MNKRVIRLIALAIVATAATVGSLQLLAGPRGCLNACMAAGNSFGQCRSICGR